MPRGGLQLKDVDRESEAWPGSECVQGCGSGRVVIRTSRMKVAGLEGQSTIVTEGPGAAVTSLRGCVGSEALGVELRRAETTAGR